MIIMLSGTVSELLDIQFLEMPQNWISDNIFLKIVLKKTFHNFSLGRGMNFKMANLSLLHLKK